MGDGYYVIDDDIIYRLEEFSEELRAVIRGADGGSIYLSDALADKITTVLNEEQNVSSEETVFVEQSPALDEFLENFTIVQGDA